MGLEVRFAFARIRKLMIASTLPHAFQFVEDWVRQWRDAGEMVLLLDFDGTLAPIVERPEMAAPLPAARSALDRLLERGDVSVAVVSGRGLRDARRLLGVEQIAYAGNHGMEIEGPGINEVHGEAAAARPALERVARQVTDELREVSGALVEDKGLTLSVHYRQVADERVGIVRQAVAKALGIEPALRLTEGKKVLEVRPAVDWHKGRAVAFLLDHLQPHPTTPVLYIGDDTTDEDAFAALRDRGGAAYGVLVADPPPAAAATEARCFVRSPAEVAQVLERFVEGGYAGGGAPARAAMSKLASGSVPRSVP